jgi:hypothetical protein
VLGCIKQSIRWKSYIRGVERAESHEAIVAIPENRALGARHKSLAEDIMRQRSHRSAIMLATALACLLFTADRASADAITVTVPVNVTNLNSAVTDVRVTVTLTGPKPAGGNLSINHHETVPVVDRAVQEDVEITCLLHHYGANALNIESYVVSLWLVSASGRCRANDPYTTSPFVGTKYDHCRQGWNMMQTYAPLVGPMSDLIPE